MHRQGHGLHGIDPLGAERITASRHESHGKAARQPDGCALTIRIRAAENNQ